MPELRLPRSPAAAYAVAALVTALALALAEALSGDGLLLAPVIGAVAVSVWVGGLGPGAFSMVMGFLVATLVLSDPSDIEPLRLGVNLAVAALVIVLGALVARARAGAERAQAANRALLDREAQARERLEGLQRVTADLARALTPEQVAEVATRGVAGLAGARGAALLELDEADASLTAVEVRGWGPSADGAWAALPLDGPAPASEAVREDRVVVAAADGEVLAAMPLVAGRPLGALLLRFAGSHELGPEDLGFLAAAARLTAAALARARRYASEHEVADVLQRNLLPARAPDAPGLEVALRYLPGAKDTYAGGDWYAALPLAGGWVALAVGDVVGHGMHAAAAMGRLRFGLLAYATEHEDPGRVLHLLSRLASRSPDTELATAALALLHPARGEVRYACAGHPPPLVAGPSGPRFLTGGRGRPLGLCDGDLPVDRAVLAPGESLMLYSDGLFERRGEPLDLGLARLLAAATGLAGDAEAQATLLVARALGGEERRDDVALLVARPLRPLAMA